MSASTVELSACSAQRMSRASARPCSPNDTIRATPAALAAAARRSYWTLSRLMTAAPAGSTPRKISALASAIFSSDPKYSRWTGAIAVITAICGSTSWVTGMIHADLKNRILHLRRAAGQRQGHAPVIVVGGGRSVRCTVRRNGKAQCILRAGLPDRARDSDHFRLGANPGSARERAQRIQHVVDDEKRRVRKTPRLPPRDHGESGPGLQRVGHKIMTVAVLARDGKERVASFERAAVDGNTRDLARQLTGLFSAHGSGHGGEGPQRHHPKRRPC